MHGKMHFEAPWSRQLKWITALTTLLLLGIPLILLSRAPAEHSAVYSAATMLPVVILAVTALFAVRGYTIEDAALLVVRPGWNTRIPLTGLQSVEIKPDAMRGSIRLFGNGGLFGFIGLFRNSALGRYRAFVTDAANCVVLRFADRTLVVTPDRPQQFAAILKDSIEP
ncbi:PH domain-containing protein [Microbulbifer hainanensis]|uniref:PH domain-containing protein n=1 Tax=Microbulbifer hainanensis TaxID=2735675 RepID=UPI0018663530|nr:PH domain-containing protein [Microbulbifer hainanensis]